MDNKFTEAYRANLLRSSLPWVKEEVKVTRFMKALNESINNVDNKGPVWLDTCKQLGIKPTYKSVADFIGQGKPKEIDVKKCNIVNVLNSL